MTKSFALSSVFMLLLMQSCIIGQLNKIRSTGSQSPGQDERIQFDDVTIKPRRTDDFRTFANRSVDILHSDLEVSFNWGKHECIGKEVLRLKPYFYQTDSIVLDAKNMTFHEITVSDLSGESIQYLTSYNKEKLRIQLERKFTKEDTLIVSIKYTARPDEITGAGGAAITDEKGLYFINTDHAEPFKPVQLWTQGEVEGSSCWFPTIDKPNEKFTLDLGITVNKELTTLSNGTLISSSLEGNLRRDRWQNLKPIPAYLVMMAVGDFRISKDQYTTKGIDSFISIRYDTLQVKSNDTSVLAIDSIVEKQTMNYRTIDRDLLNGVEVSYYLEEAYHPLAKDIFKHTPEMIDFFGAKLGVNYPWEKYAQVVVRDYVSGAMENTSATLHGESVQKNQRELVDAPNDDIIAHELFHQWFGDLVTCKSWSQLVLNEGFATLGETLWREYKYGTDAGLYDSYQSLNNYLGYAGNKRDHPIIDYNYAKADDMFNTITYQKGALVLQLLRFEIGEEAFFLSLKNYLNRYALGNADIDDFRKECELVSGQDLRPFFYQWMLKGGHPVIQIHYDYIDSLKHVRVKVEQKQSAEVGLFKFPLQFKVTQAGVTKYYRFDIRKKTETFTAAPFDTSVHTYPMVFADPNGLFIGEIKDEKSFLNHISSYYQASGIIEKLRSLKALKELQQRVDTARVTLLSAINDLNPNVREKAVEWVDWKDNRNKLSAAEAIVHLSSSDVDPKVRKRAMQVLGEWKDPSYFNHLVEMTNDSSYAVSAAALRAVTSLLPDEAIRLAPRLALDARGELLFAIAELYSKHGDSSHLVFYEQNMMKQFRHHRIRLMDEYRTCCLRLNQEVIYEKAINVLSERARFDQFPLTRANALLMMLSIYEKKRSDNQSEKDLNLKAARALGLDELKSNLQNIVDQERDKDVINLWKFKGVTQTQEVNEDR